MEKNIIIIDDEKDQAEGLAKALKKIMPRFTFESYFEEKEIKRAIEERFYTLAIVDIRMDKFTFDGIDIINEIFEINPFAKVIIVSAFKDEYFFKLKDLLLSGKVVDILDKKPLADWTDELKSIIEIYHSNLDTDPSEINKALLQYYAEAKNITDTFRKGEKFEHFVSLLFQSFGYKQIQKRVIDKTLNEVDLIIRNEIDDKFLDKFGKYILIECKNKPDSKISKNDFIVFKNKLENTKGLSELGILITSGYISWNTYYEAIRDSQSLRKIIFISNPEIEQLINSKDKREEFKLLIDKQVKDN